MSLKDMISIYRKVMVMVKTKHNSTENQKRIANMLNDSEVDWGKTQAFLGNAIADISGYIRFLDTKVSIIMAVMGVIIAGIINCRQIIGYTYNKIIACSWVQLLVGIAVCVFFIGTILVYYWGIHTIKAHVCIIEYKSTWFIREKKEEYSFEHYMRDVEKMTSKDIIDTMAAELYKLNDINKQKMLTMKYTVRAFSVTLISLLIGIIICMYYYLR